MFWDTHELAPSLVVGNRIKRKVQMKCEWGSNISCKLGFYLFFFWMHFEFLGVLTMISRPFEHQSDMKVMAKAEQVKETGSQPRVTLWKRLWFLITMDIFQLYLFLNFTWKLSNNSKSRSGVTYVSSGLLNFVIQSKTTQVGSRGWLRHPALCTEDLLGAGTLL